MLAFAELQEVVTLVEQVTIDTVPLSSEAPLDDAALKGGQTLDSSPPSLGNFDAPDSNVVTGPDLNVPEPNSGAGFPSVNATVTETLPAESAAPDIVESAGTGPDVLPSAGESAGDSVDLTPLQRYEALSNRARKPIAVDEDGTSFTFPTSITDAQESVTKSLTDIQESVTKTLTGIQEAINGSIGSAGKAVRDVFDNINGSIKGSVNSVTGLYDKTLEDVQTSVDSTVSKAGGGVGDLTSILRTGTPLNNQLKEVVVVVKGATGTALQGAGKVLTDVYGSTRVNLPPEVQSSLSVAEQKVQEIAGPLQSFLQQAYEAVEKVERAVGVDPENPIIPVFLVVGGTLYLGVALWQSRYGGYSGDLIPTSAFDLLKKETDAVLVDIRPQELRESEGIPDLRRGMRSRFATVEIITVDGSLRSRLNNAKEIDSILTASVIRNLKTVKPSTKVIVIDTDGSRSKEIARALRRFGVRRRYRVEGGYRAWTAAGLRTKLEGTGSPISILQEDAEEIVKEVKPSPGGIVLVAVGTVAGIYAAFEWEKTLQLLGVIGVGQVIYSRAKSYESVEDVKADLRLLTKPFKSLGDGILWIVGQVQPGTLSLATSPSNSAVQDRVVQAAAKHGPLASELAEDDESKSEDNVQTLRETPAPPSTTEVVPEESSPGTTSE